MDNKLIYKFPVKKSLLIVLRHMWFYAFTEAHPFSVTTYTHTPRHDSPHSLPHPLRFPYTSYPHSPPHTLPQCTPPFYTFYTQTQAHTHTHSFSHTYPHMWFACTHKHTHTLPFWSNLKNIFFSAFFFKGELGKENLPSGYFESLTLSLLCPFYPPIPFYLFLYQSKEKRLFAWQRKTHFPIGHLGRN